VGLDFKGPNGSSTFAFDKGAVLSREMQMSGSLDSVLTGVLPHELTHCVLADHFGNPLPRWADEGAACLEESEAERARYEQLLLKNLSEKGRVLPLSRLLPMRNYPTDLVAFYSQSASLTRFLVERKGRRTFLAFVRQGTKEGWETAATCCYGFRNVAELEKAWLAEVRRRGEPASETVAERTPGR
jgi:hypothetical protein